MAKLHKWADKHLENNYLLLADGVLFMNYFISKDLLTRSLVLSAFAYLVDKKKLRTTASTFICKPFKFRSKSSLKMRCVGLPCTTHSYIHTYIRCLWSSSTALRVWNEIPLKKCDSNTAVRCYTFQSINQNPWRPGVVRVPRQMHRCDGRSSTPVLCNTDQ